MEREERKGRREEKKSKGRRERKGKEGGKEMKGKEEKERRKGKKEERRTERLILRFYILNQITSHNKEPKIDFFLLCE